MLARWISWTNQLDGPVGRTSRKDQQEGPDGRNSRASFYSCLSVNCDNVNQVEVCCFIQLKIHQKFKFAEIPRTFHLQNDNYKSNLLILLKYFVKFPLRQSISYEQSSQVHREKGGLRNSSLYLKPWPVRIFRD